MFSGIKMDIQNMKEYWFGEGDTLSSLVYPFGVLLFFLITLLTQAVIGRRRSFRYLLAAELTPFFSFLLPSHIGHSSYYNIESKFLILFNLL